MSPAVPTPPVEAIRGLFEAAGSSGALAALRAEDIDAAIGAAAATAVAFLRVAAT